MTSSKTGKIIIHIAGWLLFFSLIISFVSAFPQGRHDFSDVFSFPLLFFFLFYITLFYLNVGFLIPEIYLRQKYGLYFTIAVLLFLAVYFIKPFDLLMTSRRMHFDLANMPHPLRSRNDLPPVPRFHPGERKVPHIDITGIILFVSVWSLGMALQIMRQWRNTEQRAIKAEAEKATAELSFLKAQIHPHFLFNTLNNIYSMAVLKNEHTADAILKLSNIMRYVTEDVKRDFVPLEKEIAYISDYIDLQRLRLSNKSQLEFSITGNPEGKSVAPLILMTFVENVFKYGVTNHERGAITIKLNVEEHQLFFYCQNKLFDASHKFESTGIGINNTRKRLEHLYPGKHTLQIDKNNGLYTVQLTLPV